MMDARQKNCVTWPVLVFSRLCCRPSLNFFSLFKEETVELWKSLDPWPHRRTRWVEMKSKKRKKLVEDPGQKRSCKMQRLGIG
jgi:hypothetical protein